MGPCGMCMLPDSLDCWIKHVKLYYYTILPLVILIGSFNDAVFAVIFHTCTSKYGIIPCFPCTSSSNNNLDETNILHKNVTFYHHFGFVSSICARRWCHRAGNSSGMVWQARCKNKGKAHAFAFLQYLLKIIAEAWHNSNILGQKANTCLSSNLCSSHNNFTSLFECFVMEGFPALFYTIKSPQFPIINWQ